MNDKEYHLTKELAQMLSKIISMHEKEPYICNSIECIIPIHKKMAFISPFDKYYKRGGHKINKAKEKRLNEKYGKYVERKIPKQTYHYFIIVKLKNYKKLQREFDSKEAIEKYLNETCSFFIEYFGIFNSWLLEEKYPYLKDFFEMLNEWQKKTNRVLFDEEILIKSYNKATEHI